MGLEFQTVWNRYTKKERELSNLTNQTLLFFAGLWIYCNQKSLEGWLQREKHSLRNFLPLLGFKYNLVSDTSRNGRLRNHERFNLVEDAATVYNIPDDLKTLRTFWNNQRKEKRPSLKNVYRTIGSRSYERRCVFSSAKTEKDILRGELSSDENYVRFRANDNLIWIHLEANENEQCRANQWYRTIDEQVRKTKERIRAGLWSVIRLEYLRLLGTL